MFKFYLQIFCFVIFLMTNLFAKEIKITSDTLEVDRKNNISTFIGNVYVHEKKIEIWSDKLIVKYNIDKNEVRELYVEQNVKIIRQNITATGKKGVYYPETGIFKMFENVEVIENDNYVKCDELTLDIENSTSIMRGSTQNRVQAYINEKK